MELDDNYLYIRIHNCWVLAQDYKHLITAKTPACFIPRDFSYNQGIPCSYCKTIDEVAPLFLANLT